MREQRRTAGGGCLATSLDWLAQRIWKHLLYIFTIEGSLQLCEKLLTLPDDGVSSIVIAIDFIYFSTGEPNTAHTMTMWLLPFNNETPAHITYYNNRLHITVSRSVGEKTQPTHSRFMGNSLITNILKSPRRVVIFGLDFFILEFFLGREIYPRSDESYDQAYQRSRLRFPTPKNQKTF